MYRTVTAGTWATAFVLSRVFRTAGVVMMTMVHDGVVSPCLDFNCRKGDCRDSAHQHGQREPRADECPSTPCPPSI